MLCLLLVGAGTSRAEEVTAFNWSSMGNTNTITSGYTTTSLGASAKDGYYQDNSTNVSLTGYNKTTPMFTSTPNKVTIEVKLGGGTAKKQLANAVYAQFVDQRGDVIGNAIEITSYITTAAGDVYTKEMNLTGITTAYGIKITHTKEDGYNVRYYNLSLKYTTSGGGSTPTTPIDASWSVSPENVSVMARRTATVAITTNYDGTLSVSSENSGVAIATISGKVITVTGVAEGSTTLTVTGDATSFYNAISKTINVAVSARPANEIFYESFDTNTGTGGNDNLWSGINTGSTPKIDNTGWIFTKAYGANQCARFGTGSDLGKAITPDLAYRGTAKLTFKAAAWDGSSEKTTLKLSVNQGTISPATVTLKKGEWTTYEVTLENNTQFDQKITFEGNSTSNSRFFLDEVSVIKTGEAKTLDHINVTGAKTLYKVGETFSTDGMTVTAYYDAEENDSKTISTGYTVSKTEALTAEDNTITISYTEGEVTKTADVAINVVALENIAITTAPTNTSYTEGQDFDKTDMVVTATWGTTAPNIIEEPIEDYNVIDGTGLAADQTSVTISYDGKETTQAITVTALPRYTLHITPTTDGTVYTVKAGDQVLSEGAQILYGTNLTCECDESTVPEGYYFSRFYIDFGGDKERYMSSNPATFTTQIPTEGFTELTVRCSILEQKRYTVHFDAQAGYVKPKLLTETAFQSGVVLPEATCENALWQFAGWAAEATAETNTAPELYKAGDTYKPTESTKLYAVYKQGTESGETAFNRVTDISKLTDGKKVVVVSNATDKALTLSAGDDNQYTDANTISMSDPKKIWTLTKSDNEYTFIDNQSTPKTMATNGVPGAGANMTYIGAKGSTRTYTTWIISESSVEDCWVITNKVEKNETTLTNSALTVGTNTSGNTQWGAINFDDSNGPRDASVFAMRIYVEGPATSITYNSNPEFTLLAFDEANTAITGENKSYNRVTVTRALKADTWNSFCVPFDMSEEQIEDNFGAGAQFKQLDNISLKNGENLYLTFTDAATIECGKPYLIRVSEAIPEIVVHNTSVNIAEPTAVAPTCQNDDKSTTYTVSFQGNYTKMSVPMDSYIISSDKFYHVDSDLTMKGFRGYFTTTATDNSGNEAKALGLTIGFEDPATAVENVIVGGLDDDARIYDMQGRVVTRMQKNHIYIKNGRKFLAK